MTAKSWLWGGWVAVVLAVSPARAVPEAGKAAPSFALRDLYGESRVVESARLLAGKTTLLSFFATWCKPCIAEIPKFRALAKTYRDRGFQVVLISLDRTEKPDILKFMRKIDVSGMEVLWDEEGDAMEEYGVMNLPMNVLVGPGGEVVTWWQGDQPDRVAELESRLKNLPGPR